jgi:hypothetical protein
MDSRQAIHTCARRYCIDRYEHWNSRQKHEIYADISSRQYTLQTILSDIERFRPDDFASLSHARRTLLLAASTLEIADDSEETDAAAIAEERNLYCCYLSLLGPDDLDTVKPLPYRRVLSKLEHTKLTERLIADWGQWSDGLCHSPDPPQHMIFRANRFHSDETHRALRKILAQHRHTRLWEIRDLTDGHELDLDYFTPTYNQSGEAFWTAADMNFLIYASRRNTLIFAGQWLIHAIRIEFPHWRQWLLM